MKVKVAKKNWDRRYRHPYLLWYKAFRDEVYAIYNTIDLCFLDTKTNKSKTNKKMTTNNVDCDHETVKEGVKS